MSTRTDRATGIFLHALEIGGADARRAFLGRTRAGDARVPRGGRLALPPRARRVVPRDHPAPPQRTVCAPGTMSLSVEQTARRDRMRLHTPAALALVVTAVLGLAGPASAADLVPFSGALAGTD